MFGLYFHVQAVLDTVEADSLSALNTCCIVIISLIPCAIVGFLFYVRGYVQHMVVVDMILLLLSFGLMILSCYAACKTFYAKYLQLLKCQCELTTVTPMCMTCF
jgi:hypothetical protein